MPGQFKSNVPKLFKQSKMSMLALSQKTGIARATISLLSHGYFPQRNANFIFLALCDLFECQLSDLFEYKESE